MEQRLSVLTLEGLDLPRARTFYEALGWTTGAEPDDDVVFQAGGVVVALWDRKRLASDSAVQDSPGWGGVTPAHNVRSPAEVDSVIEEAREAGAIVGREPAETFWGGYSGVFIDPDGHPWEIAHNPHWTIPDDGSVSLVPLRARSPSRPLVESPADGGFPRSRPQAVLPQPRGGGARALV